MTALAGTILPVAWEERESFLRWIHADQGRVIQEVAVQALRDLLPGRVHSRRFIGKRWICGSRLMAGAYAIVYPGNLGVLAMPRLTSANADPAGLASLLHEIASDCLRAGCTMLQFVFESSDKTMSLHASLGSAGFRHLTTLCQMFRASWSPRLDNALAGWLHGHDTRLIRYAPSQRQRWIEALDASFVQSLDCPELNGIRPTNDTLDGYLASQDCRSQWWLLEIGSKNAGCILMNSTAEASMELTYMGLVPGFRGRGLGRLLMDWGLRQCLQECQTTEFWLAVDCRNQAARHLYHRFGFETHRHLSAWIHTPSDTGERPVRVMPQS
jgi:ribosomal protein S18 acetylase RimI-like enzyme